MHSIEICGNNSNAFSGRGKRKPFVRWKAVAQSVVCTNGVFSPQVSEDDHLPKFVCTECWAKLADFHEFYEAVDEAKNEFLQSAVKEELLSFEVVVPEYDAVWLEHDIASPVGNDVVAAKAEPAVDFTIEIGEPPKLEPSNDFMDVGDLVNDGGGGSDDTHNDESTTISMDNFGEASNDPMVVEAAAPTANNALEDTSAAVTKRYDHLISHFMDMHCGECRHPFETLSDVCRHYRAQHKQATVEMKCCQLQLRLSDIRSHIQYHVKPDLLT